MTTWYIVRFVAFLVIAPPRLALSPELSTGKCVTVTLSGVNKEYCIDKQSVTWQDAFDSCPGVTTLTTDTDKRDNAVLRHLLATQGVSAAWLGGRSAPFYWHWYNQDEDSVRPFDYQGCYLAQPVRGHDPAEINRACTVLHDEKECIANCQHYKYFTMKATGEDKHGRRYWLYKCCCGDSFGAYGAATWCDSLDRRNLMDETRHYVRSKDGVNGVFSVERGTVFIPWRIGHPRGIADVKGNSLCAAVNAIKTTGSVLDLALVSLHCNEKHFVICKLDLWQGSPCFHSEGEHGRPGGDRCFIMLSKRYTWRDAMDHCRMFAPARRSGLVSFYDSENYRHLATAVSLMRRLNSDNNTMWVAGNSRRWVWEGVPRSAADITITRLADRGQVLPRPNKCLSVLKNGSWAAKDCNTQLSAFICKHGEKGSSGGHMPSATVKPYYSLTTKVQKRITENFTPNINQVSLHDNTPRTLYIVLGVMSACLVIMLIVAALLLRRIRKLNRLKRSHLLASRSSVFTQISYYTSSECDSMPSGSLRSAARGRTDLDIEVFGPEGRKSFDLTGSYEMPGVAHPFGSHRSAKSRERVPVSPDQYDDVNEQHSQDTGRY